MSAEKEFLHKEVTSDILDSVFRVHNALGCGLLEKIYENAVAWDLQLRKRKIATQKEIVSSIGKKKLASTMLI